MDSLEYSLTSLRSHFKDLALPSDAQQWLEDLFIVLQIFDDYADGDPVTRADLNSLILTSMVKMPSNPFYHYNAAQLTPVLLTNLFKWQASDEQERLGKANCKSFMWRAGYYEIVMLCVVIVHGAEASDVIEKCREALSLYGEDFNTYLGEFHG